VGNLTYHTKNMILYKSPKVLRIVKRMRAGHVYQVENTKRIQTFGWESPWKATTCIVLFISQINNFYSQVTNMFSIIYSIDVINTLTY
jgi:hypothetical protein